MVIVSVIVPFYNSSRTIKATLNSIINQSFKDFECIIVNDDSNDLPILVVDLPSLFRLNLSPFMLRPTSVVDLNALTLTNERIADIRD